MFVPFQALGVEDAVSYLPQCTSTDVAIRVCSLIKASTVSASSALFMCLLMLMPSRNHSDFVELTVVHWWYTLAPIE
jgi:pilus assembly protein TadC